MATVALQNRYVIVSLVRRHLYFSGNSSRRGAVKVELIRLADGSRRVEYRVTMRVGHCSDPAYLELKVGLVGPLEGDIGLASFRIERRCFDRRKGFTDFSVKLGGLGTLFDSDRQ
jgi:hypothetical protein